MVSFVIVYTKKKINYFKELRTEYKNTGVSVKNYILLWSCNENETNHFKQYMAVSDLSLHLGSSGSRQTLDQRFIFQIGALNPHDINERFLFH